MKWLGKGKRRTRKIHLIRQIRFLGTGCAEWTFLTIHPSFSSVTLFYPSARSLSAHLVRHWLLIRAQGSEEFQFEGSLKVILRNPRGTIRTNESSKIEEQTLITRKIGRVRLCSDFCLKWCFENVDHCVCWMRLRNIYITMANLNCCCLLAHLFLRCLGFLCCDCLFESSYWRRSNAGNILRSILPVFPLMDEGAISL